MGISIYYPYFCIYAKTHLGDPLGLSGSQNAKGGLLALSRCFTDENPPMIHGNRVELDSHIDLFPPIVQDFLVGGHRSRRGSHTEMDIRRRAGRRQHNDCPTS